MPSLVRFDWFEVDLAAGRVHKRGARVRLRDQSFRGPALLLERPGQVVTRDELRHRLWPDDVYVDFESGLNTAVARLREALNDCADRPRYIETLPRRGYRFIAQVTASTRGPDPQAEPKAVARLVVLPFVNSSGDPSQEYFSDAMTDEIITELSAAGSPELAVLARTTAMHYKGTHKDLTRIARELAVDYVVEGSVRREADRVALTIQLVRASDQAHAFARRYEGPICDIFTHQHAAARAICAQIGITPDTAGGVGGNAGDLRPARKPVGDLVAYNWYIQGRYHFERNESPESWAKARQCLEAAISRDPQFALAYDSLAELWWMTGFFGVISPREALSIGIRYATRALEIDSTLAEAHALLAQYRKQLDYNWEEVQREMALALELNPASPVVRMRRAVTGLMPFGRLEEAIAELERALDLDPMAMFPRLWLAVMQWLGRHYDRAIEEGRVVRDLAPTHFIGHFVLGMIYREVGMFGDAIAAHRKAAELSHEAPMMVGWLGFALAQSGDEQGARTLLRRLEAIPPAVYVPPTSIACVHLGLGQVADFFTWMERAIEARDHMVMPIKTYPFLDPVRTDPRYHVLLRRMNLA